MKKCFIHLSVIAAINAGISHPLYAQDEDNSALEGEDNVEVIAVRGIRKSLAKSISIKRESAGMVDAVVAEDIGKFPDANIAESLQRIPGVYLERGNGSNEGNRITIRGLDSSYAVTTINGAPVHTTSGMNIGTATRDFNYDVFPSELFGQVNVYKSARAELTEGGIGGTVDLQTPRPFDGGGEEFVRYTLNGSYNDASESTNPKGSFMYGNTWGNWGVLAGVAYAGSEIVRSGYETTGQYNSHAFGMNGQGPFRFIMDYEDPRANTGSFTREEVDNAFLPRFHRAYASANDRERLSSVVSLQYKTDDLDVSLDGLIANLQDERDEYTFGIAIRNSGTNGMQGIVPIDVYVDENNNLFGEFGNTTYFNTNYLYDTETDFHSINLRAKYYLNDDFTLRGQLTSSKSEAVFSGSNIYTQADGVTSVIDASKSTVYPTLTYDRDFTNPQSWNLGADLSFAQNREVDEDQMLLVEVKYNYDVSEWYGNVKLGIAQNVSTKTSSRKNAITQGKSQTLPGGQSFEEMPASEILALMDTSMPISPYAKGAGDDFPKNWSTYSRDTILNYFMPYSAFDASEIDYNASFEAEEKVRSVYIQTDIEGYVLDRLLRINGGVRYSRTNVTADNYTLLDGTYVPNVNEGEYSTTLPSFNLSYELTEELLFRASMGKTITRSGLNLIAGNVIIADPFKLEASAGNPNLEPEKSSSKDIALEWYFNEGGLLSVGAFWKDISDQPVAVSSFVRFSSLELPDTSLGAIYYDESGNVPDELEINLSSYVNGASQELSGLEVSYQQNFTFLPEPFNHLGMTASYTNVDTKSANWVANNGDVYNIPTVPEYGYTVSAFYENGPVAARVSYAYKSEKYTDPLNRGNDLNRVQAGIGFLDASIGYQLTDNLEIRLEGANLLDTLEYQYYPNPAGLYGDGKSRKNAAYYSGRNLLIGIRGSY